MAKAFPLQAVMITVTMLNLIILGVLGISAIRQPAIAESPRSERVLRGRSLEIVDGQGRVRATLSASPAARQPDGTIYPETVLLRLITSEGRPVVKISASEDGAGMSLGAAQGQAYVQALARGNNPGFVIVDGGGRETARLP